MCCPSIDLRQPAVCCPSFDLRCAAVFSTARRQCGCYPSPGCLRAVAHRRRRSTGIDMIHADSQELRSMIYERSLSVWGEGAAPAPALQTMTAGRPKSQRQGKSSGGEGAQKIHPRVGATLDRLKHIRTPSETEEPPSAVNGQSPSRVHASRAQVHETGRNTSASGWRISQRRVW